MRKIGDVVAGRYALAASLGGDAVGPMFRAFDLQAGQEVAVKVLEPERCNADAWQRYAQLVAAATRARSPGLVLPRLQPAGAGEPAHAVCELLVGEDLEALRARGPAAAERAVEIAAACARALGPVTTATGAAHRDLKPGNLWICADGEVRVLDYGFAELGVQPVRPRGPGVHVEYRAPEQLEGAAGDARSDVFSLAVLLFELVTGVHPFAGPSAFKVAHRVLLQAAPRPTEVAPAIPMTAAVEEVFARALAKRPADRFADLTELARTLAQRQRSEVALLPFEDEPAPAPVAQDLSELVSAPQVAMPDDMSTMLILKAGRDASATPEAAPPIAAAAPAVTAPLSTAASPPSPSTGAPPAPPALASTPTAAPPAPPALASTPTAAPPAPPALASTPTAAPARATPTSIDVASALAGPPPLPFSEKTDPDIDAQRLAAAVRPPPRPRRDTPLADDGQRTVVAAGFVARDEPLDATELLPAPESASDMATHLVQVADDEPSVTVVAPRPGASAPREEATLALATPTQELAAQSGTVVYRPPPQGTLMLDAPDTSMLDAPGTLMLDAPATTSLRPEPPRELPTRSHVPLLVAINLVAGLIILGGIAWWVLRG